MNGPATHTERYARGLLGALAFSAGVTDAVTYLALGHVFTANMTGNTVLLGIALITAETNRIARSACALAGFCAGVAIAAGLIGAREQKHLWSPRVTLALAGECVVLGALAILAIPSGISVYVLIVISGVAMGAQSAAVRAIGVPGVATTYITGTLTGMIVGVVTRQGQAVRSGGSQTARTAAGIWIVYLAAAVCGAAAREAWGLEAMWIAAAVVGAVTVLARARRRTLMGANVVDGRPRPGSG